jgi:hypothetical protein
VNRDEVTAISREEIQVAQKVPKSRMRWKVRICTGRRSVGAAAARARVPPARPGPPHTPLQAQRRLEAPSRVGPGHSGARLLSLWTFIRMRIRVRASVYPSLEYPARSAISEKPDMCHKPMCTRDAREPESAGRCPDYLFTKIKIET